MALTITIDREERMGRRFYRSGTIAFDSSYPTGGEPLTPSDLRIRTIDILLAAPAGGLMFEYDNANQKLKAIYPTGGSAAPAALADPAITVPTGATAVTSTAAQPDLTETAGLSKEVANATDLSTITGVRFVALGGP